MLDIQQLALPKSDKCISVVVDKMNHATTGHEHLRKSSIISPPYLLFAVGIGIVIIIDYISVRLHPPALYEGVHWSQPRRTKPIMRAIRNIT